MAKWITDLDSIILHAQLREKIMFLAILGGKWRQIWNNIAKIWKSRFRSESNIEDFSVDN